jgi:putative transposase
LPERSSLLSLNVVGRSTPRESPLDKQKGVRGSQYVSEQFQRLMADNGVVCSMSRSGNVWDNAAMESFFSSLKTERIGNKLYRSRDQARADVFDYIERFYNTVRRHSTIGYLSPVEFERKVGLA